MLPAKHFSLLSELVEIFGLFAEATDCVQGETTTTITCVVPTGFSMNRFLQSRRSTAAIAC